MLLLVVSLLQAVLVLMMIKMHDAGYALLRIQ